MFKLLKNLGKKQWLLAAVCFVLIVGQVWLELKMPDYMSEITVLVQTEGSQMSEIMKNGAYMLACALGSLISAIIVGYLISGISATFSMNVRKKLFTKVEDLAMNEVKKFSTSSLITRTTNDITQIQMFVAMGLQMMVKAPITAIWAVTKILNKSWTWSAITGLGVIILLSVIAILMSIVMPRFKIVQKLIDRVNGVTRENLTGIRVVRAFNAEIYQENKFEDVNTKLTNQQLFNQKAFSVLSPTMYLVMYFLTLLIYFTGAYMIKDAGMADKITLFGNMVVFSSYGMQVIMSFLMLAFIFMMLPRAQVSAERINEVLDTEISVKDGKIKNETMANKFYEKENKNDNKKNNEEKENDTNKSNEETNSKKNGIEEHKGTVEFKNVSFKYPDGEDYILKDISFKANKGETVAFIGSTGSGKSSLINLIPRFYDATEGEVLVDGINVKEYTQDFLHNKIGYVAQKAVIFNDTVNGNIAYGDNGKENISEENVKKAIEVAQAKDFVEKMEDGYDTEMAQGGTNVSGGQKQRLSIARAIARNPEIYIFDDSFSALDYKTDSILRKELRKYTGDSTILIVAQRIGTIMNADKILVLDDGKVVGNGTHKELLKSCEVYKQIALSQLSRKELGDE